MSRQNSIVNKRLRRYDRAEAKRLIRKLRPELARLYVAVSARVVRQHRYLRRHGLPYSSAVAAAFIRQDRVTLAA